VRFVTEGGPSIGKLQPGDQILAVNGEDVKDAPRDHVIQLVRACESQVNLFVCQPMAHCVLPGRKSTLLSAGKRAKLRSRPSRVRFAESVCVNGAPLFPVSFSCLSETKAMDLITVFPNVRSQKSGRKGSLKSLLDHIFKQVFLEATGDLRFSKERKYVSYFKR